MTVGRAEWLRRARSVRAASPNIWTNFHVGAPLLRVGACPLPYTVPPRRGDTVYLISEGFSGASLTAIINAT